MIFLVCTEFVYFLYILVTHGLPHDTQKTRAMMETSLPRSLIYIEAINVGTKVTLYDK